LREESEMAKKMWGGRFGKKTNLLVEEFTRSIDYDARLAGWDIVGSKIHVKILKKALMLKDEEAKKLNAALDEISDEIRQKGLDIGPDSEDIHTAIQNAVEKKAGKLALKLHTARSRNDQVIFDMKMLCKAKLTELGNACRVLKGSLHKTGSKFSKLIVPGYTHLQHAQLVLLSDYLKSYEEMLERDRARLVSIAKKIQPVLGAGALAGTPIPSQIYSEKIEAVVGGKKIKVTVRPPSNSLDSVSDRDFVIEILSALSILGMHLSRLSEDLIIWSTKEFGFVELDDAFATGSSLMPQKKNPDVLELIRGNTGLLYGNLMSALTIMKGLPLTYNRDMQLDKCSLFSSFDIIDKELKVLPGLIETVRFSKKNIEKAQEDESLYATDIVYHLVKKGVPFRNAHDIVGKLVRETMATGGKIKNMTDGELACFSGKLKHKDIMRLMNPKKSVKSRVSIKR